MKTMLHALKRLWLSRQWRHSCASRPTVPWHDAYNSHLPHYPYGSDQPNCTTCGTRYPCAVVRKRDAARIMRGEPT
ncbi:MAG: hypothetical protein JXA67_20185 [Micromonosporaceae bacterium]|nr:hypothetical protein [Micromonosporaceae bacterium]